MTQSLYIRWLLGVVLIVLGLSWVILRKAPPVLQNELHRDVASAQWCDTPWNLAEDWDSRMLLLSAWERQATPQVEVKSAPMGQKSGSFVYVAQGFMEDNRLRGGRHLGEDWNGLGGMNTDLGDPIFAVARGRVIYKGKPSEDWGEVVVLAHRLTSGEIRQSLYAHLRGVRVSVGDTVAEGQQIAEVGTALGSSAAHLHFEIMDGGLIDAGQPGYAAVAKNRRNPTDWLNLKNSPLFSVDPLLLFEPAALQIEHKATK